MGVGDATLLRGIGGLVRERTGAVEGIAVDGPAVDDDAAAGVAVDDVDAGIAVDDVDAGIAVDDVDAGIAVDDDLESIAALPSTPY